MAKLTKQEMYTEIKALWKRIELLGTQVKKEDKEKYDKLVDQMKALSEDWKKEK